MESKKDEVVRGRGRPQKAEEPPTTAVFDVRAKLGWTQEEAAKELKCSLSAIRAMEREKRLPGRGALRDNFLRVAQRAGIEVDL